MTEGHELVGSSWFHIVAGTSEEPDYSGLSTERIVELIADLDRLNVLAGRRRALVKELERRS